MPFRSSSGCHDLVTIRKSALRPSLGCACSGARKTASPVQMQTNSIEYQRAFPALVQTVAFDLGSLARPGFLGLFLTACAAAAFFVLGVEIASADLVEFTESSEFCGSVCHRAMGPEVAGYEQSAHARVACVERARCPRARPVCGTPPRRRSVLPWRGRERPGPLGSGASPAR